MTPFFLEDLRTPVAPALPWFTSFPETNVRTYVVGPDGRESCGISRWTRARLEPMLVARSTYRLPYMWSEMGWSATARPSATAAAAAGRPDPGHLGHHRGDRPGAAV